MSTPSSSLSAAVDYPEIWQVAGWQVLLPPLAGRHVLCIDAHGWLSAVLAPHCRELTVWCPELARPQVSLRLQSLGQTHVRVQGIDLHGAAPGAPSAGSPSTASDPLAPSLRALLQPPYDGLVVAHPGVLAGGADASELPERIGPLLAALAQAALGHDGFVYVECANRWGVRSSGNQPDPHLEHVIGRPVLSARAVRRALRQGGLAQVRLHPYLLGRAKLEEILPSRGYVATKNRELRRERLKELLFGRRGARLFAHAYGVVAFRQPHARSLQDRILEHLAALAPPSAPRRLHLAKVLVLHSLKVIMVVEGADMDAPGYVVVVSSDDVVTQRREQEARVLEQLARLPAEVTARIPRLVDRFRIDGHECFVLSKLPGLTLEADVAELGPVTDHAAAFLATLARHAAAPETVDAARFDEVFGTVLERAAAACPALAGEYARLRESLAPRVLGRTLPIGWFHGDYKIENLTYDPQTLQVTGVLDWEHASARGLPYVDLLYLLLYNRGIRDEGWANAFQALALDRRLTPEETRLARRFRGATGVPDDLVPALEAVFLAHHVGIRLGLTAWTPAELARIRQLLERCIHNIENAPPPNGDVRDPAASATVRNTETVNS